MGDEKVFMKSLTAGDDTILGFTASGFGAGELLTVVQLAMKIGIVHGDIGDLITTDPKLSEGPVGLFSMYR